MIRRNQKGLSLVELLVILGAAGGAILVTMNLTKMTGRAALQMALDADAQQAVNEISKMLTDPSKCLTTLTGQNAVSGSTSAITNINSKYYTKASQPTSHYGTSALQIDHYQLKATLSEVNNDQVSYLVISFLDKSILKTAASPSTFDKKIRLKIEVDGSRNITACRVEDKFNGEAFWSRDNGTDIFYDLGNVGVGISAPAALLELQGISASSGSALPASLKLNGRNNTVGEGGGISLKAGAAVEGAGGIIKLSGGKSIAGGSVNIEAGVNGGGSPGSVSFLGASGGTGLNQNSGNIVANGGLGTATSPIHGNVIISSLRGNLGIGTSAPESTAMLTVKGAISSNNLAVNLGKTSGDTRGTYAIDIQTEHTTTDLVASGQKSITIGVNNKAPGPSGIAIGTNNFVRSGYVGASAIGNGNQLYGSWNMALGVNNISVGLPWGFDNSILIGSSNTAYYHGAILMGRGNSTSGYNNQNFFGVGFNNAVLGNESCVFGQSITNLVARSTQVGLNDSGKVTITDTGNVGVGGKTNPAQKVDVNGSIMMDSCLYYAGGNYGTCASDERIKKDIHSFNVGLNELLSINPVSFKYNGLAGFLNDGSSHLGFIAQDVEKSVPELVNTKTVKLHVEDFYNTDIKTVDYGGFVYVAINSIKEFYKKWLAENFLLKKKVNQARNEIEALKEEMKLLKKENEMAKIRLQTIKERLSR